MRPNKVIFATFAAVFLTGCLPRPNVEATAAYSRQVAMAMLRVAQMEELLAGNQSRVEQLEEVIRVQGQHAASRLETMEEVNFEVSRLRGEIEVVKRELELLKTSLHDYQLAQESRQLRDEARLTQLEAFLGVQPPEAISLDTLAGGENEVGAESTVAAVGGSPAAESGANEMNADEVPVTGAESITASLPGSASDNSTVPETIADKIVLAKSHIDGERYQVARAILSKAVEANPDADEVPEMRYIIAQTWLHEEQWRTAATDLKYVLDNHSKSEWASWSMLRLGECFQGLGKGESAALFYEGVIQSYPRSDAAKEAKKRLK